jgi:hypothetical protein
MTLSFEKATNQRQRIEDESDERDDVIVDAAKAETSTSLATTTNEASINHQP